MHTAFSKLAFLLLIFALVAPDSSARNSGRGVQRTAESTVTGFYHWYLHALDEKQDPYAGHQDSLRKYVSIGLVRKLDRIRKGPDGMEADYFLQAQDVGDDWKDSISVTMKLSKRKTATAEVTLGVNPEMKHTVTVRLRKEALGWKIAEVTAAKP